MVQLHRGPAAGFFEDKVVEVEAPTPCVLATIKDTDLDHKSWYASAAPMHLGGMSGGGVMVWNAERGRAELVGIFIGYVGSEQTTKETAKLWGITLRSHRRIEPRTAYIVHRLPAEALRSRL